MAMKFVLKGVKMGDWGYKAYENDEAAGLVREVLEEQKF